MRRIINIRFLVTSQAIVLLKGLSATCRNKNNNKNKMCCVWQFPYPYSVQKINGLKRFIASFFLVLAFFSAAKSQNYQWASSFGNSNIDNGQAIQVDDAGNVYVAGHFNDTVDFDPGPGVFNLESFPYSKIFFSKYDRHGNFLWAKSIGSWGDKFASDIAIDKAGFVYFTGYFSNSLDFDPGPGIDMITNNSGVQSFITKYDTSGNYLWAKGIGGGYTHDGNAITIDNAGNILLTGEFSGTSDFDPGSSGQTLSAVGLTDTYIAKYNSNGVFIWAKSFGGLDYDMGFDIEVDNMGNVYVTGSFRASVDFDPGAGTQILTASGLSDIYFAKYDMNGNYFWVKRLGNSDFDSGNTIATDNLGNIYVAGYFTGTVDFDPGPVFHLVTSVGNRDAFFAKYDSLGNYIWARSIGSSGWDVVNNMIVDVTGSVYLCGFFSGLTDIDPGPATVYIFGGWYYNIFFAKYSSSGNYIWGNGFGANSDDEAMDISMDSLGSIYITGYFGGSIDFDPSTSNHTLTSQGSHDIFLAKYGNAITGLNETSPPNAEATVFPNPSKDRITISLATLNTIAEIRIYNALGIEILSVAGSQYPHLIDISNLNAGVYIYEASDKSGKKFFGRIIKE